MDESLLLGLYTAQAMREVDGAAIEGVGIPGGHLMERAGVAVAAEILERYAPDEAVVFAGKGNNGGDGMAAARILLNHGFQVDVFLIGERDKLSPESRKQLDIIENLEMVIWDDISEINFKGYTVLVDAIFGIGLDRPAEGKYAETIQLMNAFQGYVFAVDIPSGISADNGQVLGTAVRADVTITFGIEKIGQLLYPGSLHTGKLIVSDIGFPPSAMDVISSNVLFYEESDLFSLPRRAAYSNKGTYGRVVIIAGSANMSGAAFLAAGFAAATAFLAAGFFAADFFAADFFAAGFFAADFFAAGFFAAGSTAERSLRTAFSSFAASRRASLIRRSRSAVMSRRPRPRSRRTLVAASCA